MSNKRQNYLNQNSFQTKKEKYVIIYMILNNLAPFMILKNKTKRILIYKKYNEISHLKLTVP